jgi:membrane protease YdiL (CAAX protease family)
VIPPPLSFVLIGLFALAPIEMIAILLASKKEYGKYSWKSALVYNRKMPPRKLLLTTAILFCIAGAVALLVGKIETPLLMSTVFKFIPDYFRFESFAEQAAGYPAAVVLATCILYAITNVIVLPVVEELYFRGYLMPRLERFGKSAPILVTVLFSLYHFWAPWANLMRILAIFPYTWAVWKNKNIYIGIIVHCAVNLFSTASLIYAIYR